MFPIPLSYPSFTEISGQYAFNSQAEMHGLDPSKALIPLLPRPNEFTLRTEDILEAIAREGDSVAIIMFSGVQFYTGQCFEMQKITAAGRAKVCSTSINGVYIRL